MTDDPKLRNIRVRQRIRKVDGEERLTADTDPNPRRKRKPNSGSMKKGETRNPNGRPKGAKGTKAMVRKVLSQKTTIKDGGKTRKATLFEALFLKEVQKAFEGDWRARRTAIELGRWALPEDHPLAANSSSRDSSETDEAILDWFKGQVTASKKDQSDE